MPYNNLKLNFLPFLMLLIISSAFTAEKPSAVKCLKWETVIHDFGQITYYSPFFSPEKIYADGKTFTHRPISEVQNNTLDTIKKSQNSFTFRFTNISKKDIVIDSIVQKSGYLTVQLLKDTIKPNEKNELYVTITRPPVSGTFELPIKIYAKSQEFILTSRFKSNSQIEIIPPLLDIKTAGTRDTIEISIKIIWKRKEKPSFSSLKNSKHIITVHIEPSDINNQFLMTATIFPQIDSGSFSDNISISTGSVLWPSISIPVLGKVTNAPKK